MLLWSGLATSLNWSLRLPLISLRRCNKARYLVWTELVKNGIPSDDNGLGRAPAVHCFKAAPRERFAVGVRPTAEGAIQRLASEVRRTLRASLSGTFLQTLPELVTPLKGHSLSPRSCPPTLSALSERFGTNTSVDVSYRSELRGLVKVEVGLKVEVAV